MEEPKPYTVIDRRRTFEPEILPEPFNTESLVASAALIADLEEAAFKAAASGAEQIIDRAPDPQPGELRKANRRERKAMEKQARKDAKRLAKKTYRYDAPEVRPGIAETSPIDPVQFIALMANNLNMAVADNELLRARIPAGERMMADELQMAAQIGFMLGYLEAYGPSNIDDRHRIIAIAQDLKKQFKFKASDGTPAKPKEAPLIIAPPPSILPVTR